MPNAFSSTNFGITRLCGAAAILLASSLLFPGLARAQDFPDGPGKDDLVSICSQCHGIEAIPDLKYTRQGWQALVEQMQGNGANGTAQQFEAIVDYLTKNFGPDKAPAADKVNVNTATSGEIEQRLGLATKEAAAIVAYRTKNGNFKTLDDLKKVDGVDAKKLDAAKDRVAF